MDQKLHPSLMFTGQGGEAMAFYLSLFKDSEVIDDVRYGPEGPGKAGTVMFAHLKIKGTGVICMDAPVTHAFGMTPAVSLYVTCDDEAEIDHLFSVLSEGGEVRMELGVYPFARKYGWTDDRFGVSWQLILL